MIDNTALGHKEYDEDGYESNCNKCNSNNWLEDSTGDIYCVNCKNNTIIKGTIKYLKEIRL